MTLAPWHVLLLAASGAAGTLARYFLEQGINRLTAPNIYWAIPVVNVLGCFFYGLVLTFAAAQGQWSPQTRLYALTGFAGAFTTFSTLTFQTFELTRSGQWTIAGAYFVGQAVAGMVSLMAGIAVARSLGGL